MIIKLFAVITAIFLLAWITSSSAQPNPLTSQQIKYLLMAREAGASIGWPETMESIIWQESSIGRFKVGDDGKSLGVAHVQVDTAISIMKKYQWAPQIHNKRKIAYKLIHDDKYNLLMASLDFNDCYQQFQDWSRALICYNGGSALASQYKTTKEINSFSYVISIKHRLRQLRESESRYYVLNSSIDTELASEEIVQIKTAEYFKKLPIIPSGTDIRNPTQSMPCIIHVSPTISKNSFYNQDGSDCYGETAFVSSFTEKEN